MKLKYLFFLFLFILNNSISSQIKTDSITGKISFREVVKVKLSKEQIKNIVEKWLAYSFKDVNNVIKINTKEKIIGNGSFPVNYTTKAYVSKNKSIETKGINYVNFIIEVAFKDGKYKLEMNNFTIHNREMPNIEFPVLYYENFTKEDYSKYIHSMYDELDISDEVKQASMKYITYEDTKQQIENTTSQVFKTIIDISNSLKKAINDNDENW